MLRDASQAKTAAGREKLRYIIDCALPAGKVLREVVNKKNYDFAGGMGLAPNWVTQPISDAEAQLVSACVLARDNGLGEHVQISMRSDAPDALESLETSAAERASYTFFEAGFFGNVFLPQPVAYVCTGDDSPDRTTLLEKLKRVCSLPKSGKAQAANALLSRCNFRIVGPCSDKPFVQGGTDFSAQVIKVYLAP